MKLITIINSTLIVLLLSFSQANGQTTVIMKQKNGLFIIPCKINGLNLDFIFDTSASDVSISATEALFMLKNGYLTKDEFMGQQNYLTASGEISAGTTIILKKIEFDGILLSNVRANVVHNIDAPLLLGQSAIKQLGEYKINGNQLTITNAGPTEHHNLSGKGVKSDFIKDVYEVLSSTFVELYEVETKYSDPLNNSKDSYINKEVEIHHISKGDEYEFLNEFPSAKKINAEGKGYFYSSLYSISFSPNEKIFFSTTRELGQKVREKYPEYENISNAEISRRILTKYPQHTDSIIKFNYVDLDTFRQYLKNLEYRKLFYNRYKWFKYARENKIDLGSLDEFTKNVFGTNLEENEAEAKRRKNYLDAADSAAKAAEEAARARGTSNSGNKNQSEDNQEQVQLSERGKKGSAGEKVFTYVEQQPTFPGGESALYEYIQKNMKYPAVALKKRVSGRVYLTFVVGSSGHIRDIKIIRGIGSGCDEEAIRMVKTMPLWIPGKQNGLPVNVQFNLPINFVLE